MGTRYARVQIADAELDRVAERLGVTAEVLLEARLRILEELHARGLDRPRRAGIIATADQRLYQYHLYMPEVIWTAWREECEYRQTEGTVLLRSLIYDYLTHEREPVPTKAWLYHGKSYRMGDQAVRKHFLERATIPRGASRALTRRATVRGTRSTYVVRALVLEVLHHATAEIRLIEATQMYDDESRYCLG